MNLNSYDFALQQTALYEQFIASLQSFTLALSSSGTRVSGKIVNEALSNFNVDSEHLRFWFSRGIKDCFSFYDWANVDEEVYERWVGKAEKDANDALTRCLVANKATFLASIRFGGAFGGLSDLLRNMHGNVGLLVQKKSREMRWRVRTIDGKSVSCSKLIYLHMFNLSSRIEVLETLLELAKQKKQAAIYNKHGEILYQTSALDILLSDEICEKYFHYNFTTRVGEGV